jgi:hypothetical protein
MSGSITHVSWVLTAMLLLGCGRSPVDLDDGGAPDQPAPAELGPTPDRGVDAGPVPDAPLPPDARIGVDGPCPPQSCVERCKLVTACGLYPKGPPACLADCPGWSGATRDCLDTLLCAADEDCAKVEACIKAPPVTDLVIKDFAGAVQGDTVSYSFTVCNTGKLASGPFTVDLFYHAKAAPPLGQPADDAIPVLTGLGGEICAPFKMQRQNTPPGTHFSWLRVDPKNQVAEVDESNNLAGPVSVTVTGQAQADLVIKTFNATAVGADIVYDIEVCNQGTANAWLFRLEIYYKRILPPSPFMVGDQNVMFLLGLAGGACSTVTRTYTNAPVGTYNSFAQVDSLNTVKESDETNNVAGPRLVVMNAQSGCINLCAFATTCGLFSAGEFNQCLTWCNGMNATERTCADKAAQKKSCADLKSCNLPPPPPPPPPPWACLQICNHLVSSCNLLPQNQYLTCIGGCITLPQTKVQCALDAMDKGQCLQMSLCIL